MSFKFTKGLILEVIIIEPDVFSDERGYFLETYKSSDFNQFGLNTNFVQHNHSYSKKGTIRGLHFQKNPKAQAKLIRCIKGEIYDVSVDIRKKSETFGHWTGEYISEKNKKMIYIPVGFAHGFCAVSEDVEIIYSCSEEYDKSFESGILWNDPEINIQWPIKDAIISAKDQNLMKLSEINSGF